MTNNDILRRLRYIFDFDDNQMIRFFKLSELEVTRSEVSNWLKRDDHEEFDPISNKEITAFLDGLIIDQRGKQDRGEAVQKDVFNNNLVLKKIKIALQFKSDDILDVLDLAEFSFGPSELSAFFRKPGHKHYRPVKDQVLRNFLMGLQLKYRPHTSEEDFQKDADSF